MATQLYRTLTGQSQDEGTMNGATQPDLSRMTTTNTQSGVLNHLTEQQEVKLDEFKEQLRKEGWWSPDGVNGKPTHDDGTLLRYLRARKFDVPGAYGQFTDTEKWMKEQHVEELYEHFDVGLFERTRSMYPQWTGHRDRRGIPLYVYEIKGLDSKAIDKYQKESTEFKKHSPLHKELSTPSKHLPLFALYHNLLNFILPLCSSLDRPRPEIPVTNSTNIVDISGVSLRQFWNLKAHMQDASVLATAHYPETLDRIFIIGAPNFFPTVWGWVKRWFDPVTVSKIFILGRTEVLPVLEQFMEPECIPKKYGGGLNWQWGDVPDLDRETREALERDGNRGWVKGPALWLNNERVVVGTEHGKLRRSEKEIAEKKPIVYAADYTEEPVHPERRRTSTLSGHRKSMNVGYGTAAGETVDHSSESPTTLVEELPAAGPGADSGATIAAPPRPPTKAESPVSPATTQQQSLNVPHDSVRTSPMGDARVHLPRAQPGAPSTTAEYISPVSPTEAVPARPAASKAFKPEAAPAAAHMPAAEPMSTTAVAAAAAASLSAAHPSYTPAPRAAHPAGHTQPGPMSQYQAAVNRKIASQLEGESTIVIPASGSGPLPHPDMVVASDTTKGLAIEAEKLTLNSANTKRPHPERFVTAAEF